MLSSEEADYRKKTKKTKKYFLQIVYKYCGKRRMNTFIKDLKKNWEDSFQWWVRIVLENCAYVGGKIIDGKAQKPELQPLSRDPDIRHSRYVNLFSNFWKFPKVSLNWRTKQDVGDPDARCTRFSAYFSCVVTECNFRFSLQLIYRGCNQTQWLNLNLLSGIYALSSLEEAEH